MNHDELQAAANKALWWGGAMIAVAAFWNKLVTCVVATWGFIAMPFRLARKLNDTVEQLTKVVRCLEEAMNGKTSALSAMILDVNDIAHVAHQRSLFQFDEIKTAHFECKMPSGECIYVNPALADLLGLDADHCLGFGWCDAIHPEDVERVKGHWLGALEHWRGYRTRYRIVVKGETFTVDATAKLIVDSVGRPLRAWGTVTKMPPHL